jgi:hypothetical protein
MKYIKQNEFIGLSKGNEFYLNEFKLTPFFTNLSLYSREELNSEFAFSIPLYSSPRIEDTFFNICKESKILKPILKKIHTGIKNKNIIIGYTDPSLFKFINNNLSKFNIFKQENAYSLGFYNNQTKNINIMLDHNIDLIGGIRKQNIDIVMLHEIIHWAAANNNKTNFIKNTEKHFLIPYYFYLIKDILQFLNTALSNKKIESAPKEIVIKELRKTIYSLVLNNETKIVSYENVINNTNKYWNEFFINAWDMNNNKLREDVVNFMMYPYLKNYLDTDVKFNNKIFKNNTIISERIYYKCYKKLGLTDTRTYPGQEICFPSEIVSITNENGAVSSVINSINKIPMR